MYEIYRGPHPPKQYDAISLHRQDLQRLEKNDFASSDPRPSSVRRGREAGHPGLSGTLGTTGGLAAAVCRVGVAGRSVLKT